jgi:hypothetical protein
VQSCQHAPHVQCSCAHKAVQAVAGSQAHLCRIIPLRIACISIERCCCLRCRLCCFSCCCPIGVAAALQLCNSRSSSHRRRQYVYARAAAAHRACVVAAPIALLLFQLAE